MTLFAATIDRYKEVPFGAEHAIEMCFQIWKWSFCLSFIWERETKDSQLRSSGIDTDFIVEGRED